MVRPTLLCVLLHAVGLSCGLPVGPDPLSVSTTLGTVKGAATTNGAQRFTLPFAQPPIGPLRFAAPQPPLPWTSPLDGGKTPASCMQTLDDARGGNEPSEDCLYLTLYRPASADAGSKLPVMVWIHGGSFLSGSSTAAGLDGSQLAKDGNAIVVFVQYRLGAFGFFHTDSTLDENAAYSSNANKVPGNQAVRDVVQSLAFLRQHIAAFGGDPNAITVAGQSSGAHMVRTLLTLPAAESLFQRAILHSDPANYGPASAKSNHVLGNAVMEKLGCHDLPCLRSKSAQDILQASDGVAAQIPQSDPSFPQGEPWRPFLGSYYPTSLEESGAGSISKPTILTTVQNEAGSQVGSMIQPSVAGSSAVRLQPWFGDMSLMDLPVSAVLNMIFNEGRGDTLAQLPAYSSATTEADGERINIERVGTDGLYRCSTWTGSSKFSRAYIGVHHTGITYPSNNGNDYCAADGRACHEDDIFAVFGTSPSPLSGAQRRWSDEVRQRWIQFVKTGNPNTGTYGGWKAGRNDVYRLGGNGEAETSDEMCQTVWGKTVSFDWQLYHQ